MKTIIIDSNHLLNRTFHIPSFQHLSTYINDEKVNTGALYGFIWSIKKINQRKNNEDEIYAVWDGGGKNWRHEFSADYKANRKKKSTEFYKQLTMTYDVLKVLGIAQCRVPNTEADDLIGSLAKKSRMKGNQVLIISSDKDFNQLVSKHIHILHPEMANNDEKLMTPEQVKEDYQLPPSKFADYLAIVGDNADNIAGLDGVGKKGARDLILANGSIEEILANDIHYKIKNGEKKPVSKKLQEKINNSKDILKKSRTLVDIKCDIDIDNFIDKSKPDFKKLKEYFRHLRLRHA